MKKLLRNYLFIALISVTSLLCFTACRNNGSDNIAGTWSVSSYKYQDKVYTQDEIAMLFGNTFNDAYGQTVIIFASDGTVDITAAENNHHTGTYTVSGDTLSIYDSDELIADLTYQNGYLELVVPDVDVVIIFEKQ